MMKNKKLPPKWPRAADATASVSMNKAWTPNAIVTVFYDAGSFHYKITGRRDTYYAGMKTGSKKVEKQRKGWKDRASAKRNAEKALYGFIYGKT